MTDRIQSFKVICRGGLNSNENHLDLAENAPGSATRLINYEPSVFGGYRRIEGYALYDADFPEVGVGASEGKILGVAVFRNEQGGLPYVIAARKDIGTNSYSFWKHIPLIGWQKFTLPFTLLFSSGGRTVSKVRHVQFDFGAGGMIGFADGVNKAVVFDGTTWRQLASTGAGTAASPGGNQALDAPAIIDVFENHLFLAADPSYRSVVSHSAPNAPFNFTAASGGGQIPVGFHVVQFKPFRDNLYVFGSNAIKRITPDVTAGFVLDQVTANVGCIARDSVLEVGGDLVFLAPDGLRPVAGTSRIGDVELETISKSIKGRLLELIKDTPSDLINGVVVRSKSQIRYFFGGDDTFRVSSPGILGGLTEAGGSIGWEYSELLGLRASCCTSEYVNGTEYVIHGDFDGRIYRQEQGVSFAGDDIVAIYSTPYLDFGDTEVRKVIHKLSTFVRAEGPFSANFSLQYDWGDQYTARPSAYTQDSTGAPTVYGGRDITYGGSNVTYGGNSKPVILNDVQGSGYSVRANFVTVGQFKPYSIQGMVFEFALAGRR